MQAFLQLSTAIDEFNRRFGQLASWMVLLSCMISAGNAGVRYLFSMSSNGWLEIQWQMFAAIFLLGAANVFKLNEHVRVDLFYGSASARAKLWIDVVGLLCFFFPAVIVLGSFGWPFFLNSFRSGEFSSNAGGLILWPVKFLLPFGFLLLLLQGVSEFIKRIAALRGLVAAETVVHYEKPLQ